MRDVKSFAGILMRYSLVTAGPVGASAAQFVLSLVLLRFVDPGAFGSFSFLLTASQFSLGISNALFCAVLPILMADEDASARRSLVTCLFTTNLVGAGTAFALFVLLGCALGVSVTAAGLFAAYAAVGLIRWFARAHAYATGEYVRSVASDVTYSVAILAGLTVAVTSRRVGLEFACATLLVSAAAGVLPFGRRYLARQFVHVRPRDITAYGRVWHRHSGWALLGVVTTEATANSHVYIVTLIYGPLGFAPIAASALLVRPIGVAMNALADYERAHMARQVGEDRIDLAMASVRFLRFVLILAWIATAIGIALILRYASEAIFPPQYSLSFLVTGAALWMAVAGMRVLRTPEGILLQAAGAFRPLAVASVVSSGISVAAVMSLVAASGALWSIAGILIGEIVIAGWIWREARRWRPPSRAAEVRGSESPDTVAPIIAQTSRSAGASR